MWEEIETQGKRFLELRQIIHDPESATKPQYASWLKEYGRLTKVGELYVVYDSAEKEVAEAEAIIKDPKGDQELKELAREELPVHKENLKNARQALVDLGETFDLDEDAARNVIVEIHAGVGGNEAALFVCDLFEMYKRFADRSNLKLVPTNSSPSEIGGMKEVTFRVEGAGAFGEFRYEGGGHRVQRVPQTETQGRIHTSMARVAVLPEAEEVDVQIDPNDVEEKFCGAGGPGGQNVNKVATQCQLTHKPSGIIVHCIETRSQKTNRERAWQILRSKLYAIEKSKADQARSDNRLGQIGSGDRSERIRTYNFPQGRCTDHRLEGEDKNWPIASIMNGELDGLLERLKWARKAQRS